MTKAGVGALGVVLLSILVFLAVSSWAVFNLVARLFWPLLGISLGAGS